MTPRILLLASTVSVLAVVAGGAQSAPSDVKPLPAAANWDALYQVFHQHRFVDDGAVAEGFSDFIVHRLATRWSTLPSLARLTAKDSAFTAFIIRHIDATTDLDELRVLERQSANCPARVRSLCSSIHAAARQAVDQQK